MPSNNADIPVVNSKEVLLLWFIVKFGALLISIIYFIFSLIYSDINLLFISLLIFYIYSVIFAIEKIQQRLGYLFFLITFFVFLLGNYTYLFFNESDWWKPFSQGTTKNTIYCLIMALVSINFGYILGRFFKKNDNKINVPADSKVSRFNVSLKRVSKLIFWITFIPSFYLIIDEIIFFQAHGYLELYLSYSSGSVIFEKLKVLNLVSFFMFLASMPNKKESKLEIFAFLLISLLTLFSGARATSITSFMTLLFYLIYRNYYDSKQLKGDIWLSKKIIFLISILIPFVVVFLSFWGYYRMNMSLEGIKVSELFFGFFKSQGESVKIINYVQELELPYTNISYTFGPVIFFLKYNIFSKVFFEFPMYAPQTVDSALFGNNMSSTISYLVMPENYLAGLGMGSTYIAELLYDYGYLGVIIFNIILGIVLYKFSNINPNKPWLLAILLLVLNSLLTLPRDVALNWFADVINITTVGSILMIYFLAKLTPNKSKIKIKYQNNPNET